MVRMFLLGTLVPLVSLDSAARDVFQSLVSIIDLFGIYYAVNQTVGKPEIKVSWDQSIERIFSYISRFYRSWLDGAWQRVSYQPFWSTGMAPVNMSSLGNILTFRLTKILISFNLHQQLFWSGYGHAKVSLPLKYMTRKYYKIFRLESKYGSSCIICAIDVVIERILCKSAFWWFCFDGKYFSNCNHINILILTVFVHYCTLDQLPLHLKCTCA